MATLSTDRKSGSRRIFFTDSNGTRKSVRLGKMPKKQAEAVLRHISELVAAQLANSRPDAETARWLGGLGNQLRNKLVKVGLADASAVPQSITVEALIRKFLSMQPVKESTRASYKQTTDSLIAHFGATTQIASITAEHVDGWHKSLSVQGLAPATIAKRINTAKTVFDRAVRWGIIKSSPIAHLRRGQQVNPSRLVYVSAEQIEQVLATCPDAQCKAIVGLARFAGLRCPSEVISLRWGDINFGGRRPVIKVYSTKLDAYGQKAMRDIPLDPRLRDLLLALGPGKAEDRVITRIHSTETNLRKMLLTAIKKAGLVPWPRVFQNLRASCEMDWNERVSAHQAASWIGHSVDVAAKHYVRVRDEHFERITGTELGGANCGAQAVQNPSLQVPARKSNDPQETPQVQSFSGSMQVAASPSLSSQECLVGGEGFEPP